MDLIYKLVQNLILYFVLVMAEHSVHMGNDALVLSSVYDAMKNNYAEESTNTLVGPKFNVARNQLPIYELRNKRNINDRWDIDYSTHDEHNYQQQQQQFLKNDGWVRSLNYSPG